MSLPFSITTNAQEHNDSYRPIIYRLQEEQQRQALQKLLAANKAITVYDQLYGQLEELIKSAYPTINFKADTSLLAQKVNEHLAGVDPQVYGVWVYYPWSAQLIHLLDEQEFALVRTNRNKYKITAAEQLTLSSKKVGVMGLSVGQSVALTMAMERSFGQIRLADFDRLELTNYNRIRTGLANLGLHKAVAVAREIAQIDPFLDVVCFCEGITQENVEAFFTHHGKLDLFIDECDGLDMKIIARQVAKRLQVPVIMEASDRSAIDVERFDLEPHRPILHGWLEHLDLTKVREAKTNEEKIPYLLAMMKMDTVSPKFKATMLEIEQSVTTWPQLAAEVLGGGAIMANLARRIHLGLFKDSGRYYVDIDELIADKKPAQGAQPYVPDPLSIPPPPLSKEEALQIASTLKQVLQPQQVIPSREMIETLVGAAALAPSGANNQPWQWLFSDGALLLFHDRSRSVSFIDYDDVAAQVALGAALENLVLATQQLGLAIHLTLQPLKKYPGLTAVCRFYDTPLRNNPTEPLYDTELVNYIPLRCTNRLSAERRRISPALLATLTQAATSIKGARVQYLTSQEDIQAIGQIITAAERLRFMHPQGHKEFFEHELRWNKQAYEAKRDGIDLRTLNLTLSEQVGMMLASEEPVISLLRAWKAGKGFEKISKKAIDSAAAFGLLTMPHYSALDHINGGRAVERLWLTATKNKVAFYPMSGPLFLFPRLIYGHGIGMDKEMINELQQLRRRFTRLFDLKEQLAEVFLFRLSFAADTKLKSLRRPLEEILWYGS